jgi:8-oxo-dGTP pyrophosphatase MutT (NUDIX family)
MRGDGNGWVRAGNGRRFWGRFGAAGLLLVAPDPNTNSNAILLQRRALRTQHGNTWGLPGGAIDSHETCTHAALREVREETGLDAAQIAVTGSVVTPLVPRAPIGPIRRSWPAHRHSCRSQPRLKGTHAGWASLTCLICGCIPVWPRAGPNYARFFTPFRCIRGHF